MLNASLNGEQVSDYTLGFLSTRNEYAVQAPSSNDRFILPAKIYINGNLWTTIVATQ